MPTSKNIQFTRLLKSEGALREFNFRRSLINEKVIFNVDVTDDRGNRILFFMQKQDDHWAIGSHGVHSWITDNESNLSQLIEEELNQ